MTGKWISVPAVLWAMDDAPDVPPELVSTLLAVARYASENGTGAYPSASTIAAITRKTERQAKRDLARLEQRGLLLPGDKNIVKDIRADRRPKVRDLPMPRGDTHDTSPGLNGVTPRVRRGDIQGSNGVSHMSPEEVLKTSRRGVRGEANAAPSPRHAKPKHPPRAACPGCGRPFRHEVLLAQPEFAPLAESGQLWCSECIPPDDMRPAVALRPADGVTSPVFGAPVIPLLPRGDT